jgi:hypothetical protein
MKYTSEQKTELRTALKIAGYGCKIQEKQSPFSDKIVTFLSFVLPDKSAPMISANCFASEFRNKHAIAFDIVNGFEKKYKK